MVQLTESSGTLRNRTVVSLDISTFPIFYPVI